MVELADRSVLQERTASGGLWRLTETRGGAEETGGGEKGRVVMRRGGVVVRRRRDLTSPRPSTGLDARVASGWRTVEALEIARKLGRPQAPLPSCPR